MTSPPPSSYTRYGRALDPSSPATSYSSQSGGVGRSRCRPRPRPRPRPRRRRRSPQQRWRRQREPQGSGRPRKRIHASPPCPPHDSHRGAEPTSDSAAGRSSGRDDGDADVHGAFVESSWKRRISELACASASATAASATTSGPYKAGK